LTIWFILIAFKDPAPEEGNVAEQENWWRVALTEPRSPTDPLGIIRDYILINSRCRFLRLSQQVHIQTGLGSS
jgi:hypothetical protein